MGDWDEVERYAKALTDFGDGSEWPTADGIVARGRFGRGERGAALLAELDRLRAEADRFHVWEPGFDLLGVGSR
ncbi:MAG: hypothetical protein VYE73_13960 [Acidobacteriota bacterium]|nr:hypothetical protein [Acidobacteriota bacterium]